MTDADDVLHRVDADDVELVRIVFVNNSGVPRGRVVDAESLPGVLEEGTNVTQAMQSFNALDALAPEGRYGPAGEVRVVPDPETYTDLPYAERAALLLADLRDLDGEPWAAGPRAQLREYLDDIGAEGYVPRLSFESEFYYTTETDDGETVPFDDSTCFASEGMQSAHDPILDTVDALKSQGMGLSAYYPEYGPGQQELVVDHDDGVAASDSQILFTETVKAVADAHGLGASFRPTPFDGLPGNGCHIHLSVWREGENVLYDPDAEGRYPLSDAGRFFVGGLLEHAPALVAVTAPTVESYDRLAPGMWASAYTCWGHDNREAMVRIPSVDADNPEATTRVEFKPADNTTNPYLAQLGLLAAGFDGIERELDPGEPLNRDPGGVDDAELRERGIERLPESLAAALDAFEADDVLAEALGEPLHGSFLEVKRSEWAQSTEDGEVDTDYLDRGF
ncbi:gamma-glutamylputrescine synthetase [Halobellus ruber]|uniref:Glutamine synthetase n=1 Tax=Halobellus ruber TaxID=2761102 RepID=A0A7J9SHB4_9EURY|nr:gamma-glutamylputrescine synthetase [Halobellus ruber]MBB6645396.1 glutamine synthetase [Halobellus ruber]